MDYITAQSHRQIQKWLPYTVKFIKVTHNSLTDLLHVQVINSATVSDFPKFNDLKTLCKCYVPYNGTFYRNIEVSRTHERTNDQDFIALAEVKITSNDSETEYTTKIHQFMMVFHSKQPNDPMMNAQQINHIYKHTEFKQILRSLNGFNPHAPAVQSCQHMQTTQCIGMQLVEKLTASNEKSVQSLYKVGYMQYTVYTVQ